MIILLHCIALLILLLILISLKFTKWSLSRRTFIALILGAAYGFFLEQKYLSSNPAVIRQLSSYLDIIGIGYVRLLQMTIIPLVLVSIMSAILQLEEKHAIKKISSITIGVLLSTTAIAGFIGIVVANLFKLNATGLPTGSSAILEKTERLQEMLSGLDQANFPSLLLNFIPNNIFYDLTGARPTSTIAVVIIASILGILLYKFNEDNPKKAAPLVDLIHSFQELVMRLVRFVLELTPYGIFALMIKLTANSNIEQILQLANFLIASYVALILMFVVHLIIISLCGRNPILYIKQASEVLVFAFTTRSSAGSIPLNIQTQTHKLKISKKIANFSATLGATIGQNGCAGIYPAMLAVMVAPTVGINPTSVSFIFMLVVIITISSLGVAGVGGGATFAALIVLSTMGLPVTIAALLISIEPLIDMGRTALNVNGSITAGIVTDRIVD